MKNALLTIDDGPSSRMREKVDFLESKNIKAVWFCRGDFLEERPAHALYAIKHGHIIANHSYSHPKFSDLDLVTAYAEIDHTDQIIERLYLQAKTTPPYKAFRFPYGDKGDLRYGDLSQPITSEGRFKKDAIQLHLQTLGYTQPVFQNMKHAYHRAQNIFRDIDWRWTFDAMEWGLKKEIPPKGFETIGKILAAMDHDDPALGRELNNAGTDELLLIHDQAHSHDEFSRIIEKWVGMGFHFLDPSFSLVLH